MTPQEILNDKSLKATEQAALLIVGLENATITVEELLHDIERCKPPMQSKILGALEGATRKNPALVSATILDRVILLLEAKEPAVIRESARVIANTIHLQPSVINEIVPLLFKIANHEGTVIRWSAATALNAIASCIKDKSLLEKKLTALSEKEEQASIVKIYQKALRTLKKRA